MKHLVPLLVSLALLACSGCNKSASGGSGATDTDTDADSDTDMDSDMDSDSDTDTDSDSDSDGDTDTWPDGDTAPGGFGEIVEACWIATFDGLGYVWSVDVVAFPDGSSVVAGGYDTTVTFGQGEPNETTLGSSDGCSYLARFDADGSLMWANALGGDVYDIDARSDGSTAVLGEFSGTVVFGLGDPNETTLASFGDLDLFLAVYGADGELVWVRQDGGDESVEPRSLAVMSNDSFIVAGLFDSPTVFGLGEEHETIVEPDLSTTVFVANYYVDGTLAWVLSDCGNGCQLGRDIAAHPLDGAFLLTGSFMWMATFAEGQPNETVLVSEGFEDSVSDDLGGLFMASYDLGGELLWVRSAESNWAESELFPTAAAMDDGSYLVAGKFLLDLGFAFGEPDEVILHAPAEGDESTFSPNPAMFVARLTEEGEFLWALSSHSGFGNQTVGVNAASLTESSFVMSGWFSGAVNFGLGEPSETWLVSSGDSEPFAAVYDDEGGLEWVARVGDNWGSGTAASVAALDDGTFLLAGSFEGIAEFLVGEDEWETVISASGTSGFLLHVCP